MASCQPLVAGSLVKVTRPCACGRGAEASSHRRFGETETLDQEAAIPGFGHRGSCAGVHAENL